MSTTEAGAAWDWAAIETRCFAEALRMLRRRDDAEEVTQEALARAWRGRHSCRTPEAPLGWCLQITRNEALRTLQRSRRAPHSAQFGLDDQPDRRATREGERTLERITVSQALQKLTPPDRHLIALRYAHDYSHPEIARKLQIPEATARVRLHRAQQRLKPLLEESR